MAPEIGAGRKSVRQKEVWLAGCSFREVVRVCEIPAGSERPVLRSVHGGDGSEDDNARVKLLVLSI